MTERSREPAFDADEASALGALGISGPSRRRLSGCPDPALVLALDEGVLDEDLAARVRLHVSSCLACQTAAAELARVFDEDVSPESRRRIDAIVAAGRPKPARAAWFWLVPAGGLAVAAGLVWAVIALRPATPALPDTQIARVTPPATPTVFVLDRPAIPPGDVDLTVRGDTTTRSAGLADQIATALDLSDAGNVQGALSALDALARQHPESRHAGLALGATHLRADRNVDAVSALERARVLKSDPESPESNDEIDWFLGMALVRTGNRDRARVLLDGVCKRAGARSARACAGLAEINRGPSSQ